MKIKVGIIEDDIYILEDLREIIKTSRKLEYVMSATSAEQFLKYFQEDTCLDILITDIGLPGMSGIEAIMKIKSKSPETEVIVLTSYHDNDTIFKALRAGATGYILKDATLDELEQKMIDAKNGKPALSPAIANRIISYFNTATIKKEDYELSNQESQMLHFLIDGLSYKQIASKFDITLNGARYHVKKIYRKLHINSRPELIKMYLDGKFDY